MSVGIVTLGVALIVMGASFGISRIASSAMEAMSRQPEIANKAQVGMIISAALIEGVALFGTVVCLLAVNSLAA